MRCYKCGKVSVGRKDVFCRDCRKEYQNQYNEDLKKWVISKLGNKCARCGHKSEYACDYDIHHLSEDSTWSKPEYIKKNSVSNVRNAQIISWRKEGRLPDDIQLLCVICHRRVHAGIMDTPDT